MWQSLKESFENNKLKYLGVGVLTAAGLVGATYCYVGATRKRQKLKRIIDMIPELQAENVRIRDRDDVEQLLCTLIQGGTERLQFVVDFDNTVTKFMHNGVKNPTSHGVLDNSPMIPEDSRKKLHALREKYYPLEIAHDLTMAEKVPYMVEWWSKAHELIVDCDLNKDKLKKMVALADAQLRDGCITLFSKLFAASVPTLVFSAGVGDVLEEVFRLGNCFYDNMRIVSNYMQFNDEGKLVGFKNEMIHTYNKNETAIHNSDYFDKLRHRTNIILVGDSLGDLHMADGADGSARVLKIGFLNDMVESRLASYMDGYDIVIIKDETMNVINALLRRIL